MKKSLDARIEERNVNPDSRESLNDSRREDQINLKTQMDSNRITEDVENNQESPERLIGNATL